MASYVLISVILTETSKLWIIFIKIFIFNCAKIDCDVKNLFRLDYSVLIIFFSIEQSETNSIVRLFIFQPDHIIV